MNDTRDPDVPRNPSPDVRVPRCDLLRRRKVLKLAAAGLVAGSASLGKAMGLAPDPLVPCTTTTSWSSGSESRSYPSQGTWSYSFTQTSSAVPDPSQGSSSFSDVRSSFSELGVGGAPPDLTTYVITNSWDPPITSSLSRTWNGDSFTLSLEDPSHPETSRTHAWTHTYTTSISCDDEGGDGVLARDPCQVGEPLRELPPTVDADSPVSDLATRFHVDLGTARR